MLGWEFPPFISGGLGTACYGLTRALSAGGAEILFVLPRPVADTHTAHVRLLTPLTEDQAEEEPAETRSEERAGPLILPVPVALRPYARPAERSPAARATPSGQAAASPAPAERQGGNYGGDLFAEVHRYVELVCRLARRHRFDVVHAHDWMTFPAAVEVAARMRKPLVLHVHSTEFDRSGISVNQQIYDIERAGMHRADALLAVSRFTLGIMAEHYGTNPSGVTVVHNGIELNGRPAPRLPAPRAGEQTVLFMGRITRQKGPEYFLAAARLVLEVLKNVRFIMAGSGDRLRSAIDLAAQMGIAGRVVFTGFLRGADVERVFRMADLFVMPSVSEPFGLVPLEALNHGVPVIISRQSGVAEVLPHAPAIDFWDVDTLARCIIATLKDASLRARLLAEGRRELETITWDAAARRCLQVYRAVTRR